MRVAVYEQRSLTRSPGGSLDKHVNVGVQPDSVPAPQYETTRPLIHESSATCCDDRRSLAHETSDHSPLAVAKITLAKTFEDFRDGQVGRALDLAVAVNKGKPQSRSKPLPDGGLARPHQTHKNDGAKEPSVGEAVHGA